LSPWVAQKVIQFLGAAKGANASVIFADGYGVSYVNVSFFSLTIDHFVADIFGACFFISWRCTFFMPTPTYFDF